MTVLSLGVAMHVLLIRDRDRISMAGPGTAVTESRHAIHALLSRAKRVPGQVLP